MDLLTFIGLGDTYMPLIAICVFLFLWKRIHKQEYVLFVYTVLSAVLFGISNILGFMSLRNLPIYHIASLAELVIVTYYITRLLTQKSFSQLFLIISITYFICWVCNIIFLQPLHVFNGNTSVLACLIILFLCMYYLLTLSNKEEILYFQKLPSFWIVSGFLMYSALSLLVFISYGYINELPSGLMSNQIWTINSIAVIIKYVLMCAGLLCYRQSSRQRKASFQSVLLL